MLLIRQHFQFQYLGAIRHLSGLNVKGIFLGGWVHGQAPFTRELSLLRYSSSKQSCSDRFLYPKSSFSDTPAIIKVISASFQRYVDYRVVCIHCSGNLLIEKMDLNESSTCNSLSYHRDTFVEGI